MLDNLREKIIHGLKAILHVQSYEGKILHGLEHTFTCESSEGFNYMLAKMVSIY